MHDATLSRLLPCVKVDAVPYGSQWRTHLARMAYDIMAFSHKEDSV